MLSQEIFIIALLLFSALMIGIALYTKKVANYGTFFAAGRNVNTLGTALATSIGWMWADCFFSTTQIGYESGVYGLLWFGLSSCLGFIFFACLAVRVRDEAPDVVTIPEYVDIKSGNSKSVHITLAAANILYQIFVLGLNATITGFLLNTAFGFNYYISSASIIVLVLTYSMINGLKTSTVTGILQIGFIAIIMGLIIATLFSSVHMGDIKYVLGSNDVQSVFDPEMVLALGIPVAIILLTQPFVDQMIFQRLIALKKPKKIIKSFTIAGLICGLAVFLFGTLGFIGYYLADTGQIQVEDTQMAVVQTINHYLPDFGVLAFIIAFFAVVFSTIDAGYCAVAALASIDVYKKYVNKDVSEKSLLTVGRIAMVIGAVLAVLLAMVKLKILWMLFIIGVIGGAMVAPIIFAMGVKYIDPRYITASVIVALIIALPLSIYGNIVGNSIVVSGASIGSILIGAMICWFGTKTAKT